MLVQQLQTPRLAKNIGCNNLTITWNKTHDGECNIIQVIVNLYFRTMLGANVTGSTEMFMGRHSRILKITII